MIAQVCVEPMSMMDVPDGRHGLAMLVVQLPVVRDEGGGYVRLFLAIGRSRLSCLCVHSGA